MTITTRMTRLLELKLRKPDLAQLLIGSMSAEDPNNPFTDSMAIKLAASTEPDIKNLALNTNTNLLTLAHSICVAFIISKKMEQGYAKTN